MLGAPSLIDARRVTRLLKDDRDGRERRERQKRPGVRAPILRARNPGSTNRIHTCRIRGLKARADEDEHGGESDEIFFHLSSLSQSARMQ